MDCYKVYRSIVRFGRQKWLWWSLALLIVLVCSVYQVALYVDREFRVAEERPFFDVDPRPEDDTLRVTVIGDSWAEWHKKFNCDTLFQQYGGRLTTKPIKCMSRGKGGAKSKEVYYNMFTDSRPLLEQHPDYCVVMVGINDTWKKRPVSYFTGNYRLIIRLLLANNIRPVVMEIPDFEMGEWLDTNRKRQRFLYRIYSYFNGVVEDDITPFRNGLSKMLKETQLGDSVLFIPANHWLPQNHNYSEKIYQVDHVHLGNLGYHLLDSCIASEIIKDYNQRMKTLAY